LNAICTFIDLSPSACGRHSVPRRPMKRKTRYIMPVAKSTWIG
jgi:hypothetical protein